MGSDYSYCIAWEQKCLTIVLPWIVENTKNIEGNLEIFPSMGFNTVVTSSWQLTRFTQAYNYWIGMPNLKSGNLTQSGLGRVPQLVARLTWALNCSGAMQLCTHITTRFELVPSQSGMSVNCVMRPIWQVLAVLCQTYWQIMRQVALEQQQHGLAPSDTMLQSTGLQVCYSFQTRSSQHSMLNSFKHFREITLYITLFSHILH